MIEGNVEAMLLDSFHDWRSAESIVTQMVMRQKGVFKTSSTIIYLSDNDDPPEELVMSKSTRRSSFGISKTSWSFSMTRGFCRTIAKRL